MQQVGGCSLVAGFSQVRGRFNAFILIFRPPLHAWHLEKNSSSNPMPQASYTCNHLNMFLLLILITTSAPSSLFVRFGSILRRIICQILPSGNGPSPLPRCIYGFFELVVSTSWACHRSCHIGEEGRFFVLKDRSYYVGQMSATGMMIATGKYQNNWSWRLPLYIQVGSII